MLRWSVPLGLVCLLLITACNRSGGTTGTADAAPGLPPNPILSTIGNVFAAGRPDAEVVPMPTFHPTAELVTDPELRPLVDRLAAATRIESAAIGAAGAPSQAYKDHEALVGRATREQILALLLHTSPVVRGYLAMHVADHLAPDAAAVYPLLRDETSVERVEGCTIFATSLSDVVVEALGNVAVRTPSATDLLLRAANDRALTPAIRGRALTSAAPLRKTEVRAAALAMLDENDHALVRDALMALGMIGAVDVSERIAKFAADPENLVRAQVATSLGLLHARQAPAVLATLVKDDDRYVRQSAARQYGALPEADPAVLRGLLAQTERSRVGELTAEGLARVYRLRQGDDRFARQNSTVSGGVVV